MEKVHDRESLARPEPEISSMWSRMMLRKRASAIIGDNSDGFTCSRGHRAAKSGFGANGRAAGSRTNTTNSGGRDAARSRDGTGNVRRNRYRGESAELPEIGRYLRHKDRPESQSHAASSFNDTGHGCIQA